MINRWNLIVDLIRTNRYTSVAEVGVSMGDTALGVMYALENYKLSRYYGIDSYIDPYYAITSKRANLLATWSAYKPLKMTSDEALAYIEELDLVFIDGSHDQMQMCKDVIQYGDKLKNGGCLVGHDFMNPLMPLVTNYLETIMGKEINIIQDKRDENGKPNYLWWTYKVEEGVYAKVRPNQI